MDLKLLKSKIYADFNAIPKRELLMFYGDNGSGKTKFALEVAADITPPGKKILYVDTSAGYETLNNHPELHARIVDRLLVLPFVGEDQLNSLAGAIAGNLEGFGAIGTVILDESSSMAQSYLDCVVEGLYKNEPLKHVEDKPDWDAFNIGGGKWRKTIQKFERIQGVSLIEVAHMRTDNRRKIDFISPAFQPKAGNETRKEKRVIAYCDVRDYGKPAVPTFVIQTQKDDYILAKTRVMFNGQPLPAVVLPEVLRAAIKQDYDNRITEKDE
jgi:energy-coupling factor transporter ATP-binding protein EcfA2